MEVKRHLEYALFRLVESVSRMLGPRRAYEAGSDVGRLGFRLLTSRRTLALRNLWRALPALGPGIDLDAVARATFEHFSGSVMESMATLGKSPYGTVDFEGLERVDAALARGRGAIGVIAHLGNWELAGMAASRTPYPVISVARPVHNPILDRYFTAARARSGQRIILNHGSIAQLVQALRENSVLVIPCDQWPKRGVVVDFFGRPTLSLCTPAVLALRCGAPILPLEIFRGPGPRHRLRVTAPIEPSDFARHGDPVRAITQKIARRLESFIRAHPDQWMWMHDRWKPLQTAEARAIAS